MAKIPEYLSVYRTTSDAYPALYNSFAPNQQRSTMFFLTDTHQLLFQGNDVSGVNNKVLKVITQGTAPTTKALLLSILPVGMIPKAGDILFSQDASNVTSPNNHRATIFQLKEYSENWDNSHLLEWDSYPIGQEAIDNTMFNKILTGGTAVGTFGTPIAIDHFLTVSSFLGTWASDNKGVLQDSFLTNIRLSPTSNKGVTQEDFVTKLDGTNKGVTQAQFLSFPTTTNISASNKGLTQSVVNTTHALSSTNKLATMADIQSTTQINWGNIVGTLSAQEDLSNALNAKVDVSKNVLSGSTFTYGPNTANTAYVLQLANSDGTSAFIEFFKAGGQLQLRYNTDNYDSESVFYTFSNYAIMERKRYQSNGQYVSQQLILEDSDVDYWADHPVTNPLDLRPLYDVKQNSGELTRPIALQADITAALEPIEEDITTLETSLSTLQTQVNTQAPDGAVYFTTTTLSLTPGGTTSVTLGTITKYNGNSVTTTDLRAGFTEVVDTDGTIGVIIAVTSSNVTVRTETSTGGVSYPSFLGVFATHDDLPGNVSAFTSATPKVSDYVRVTYDDTETPNGTYEWSIVSIGSDGTITWGYPLLINTSDYQEQSSAAEDGGKILTGGTTDGTFGTSLDVATEVDEDSIDSEIPTAKAVYDTTYYEQAANQYLKNSVAGNTVTSITFPATPTWGSSDYFQIIFFDKLTSVNNKLVINASQVNFIYNSTTSGSIALWNGTAWTGDSSLASTAQGIGYTWVQSTRTLTFTDVAAVRIKTVSKSVSFESSPVTTCTGEGFDVSKLETLETLYEERVALDEVKANKINGIVDFPDVVKINGSGGTLYLDDSGTYSEPPGSSFSQQQSNWTEDNPTSVQYIQNKPTIPAAQVQVDWSKSSVTGDMSTILNKPTLATVATTGAYNDLTGKPTIPAAQVQTDWNASTGMGVLLNKPTLATVAATGAYNDLTGKPTIPAAQVQVDWNATSVTGDMSSILNKPTLATVATTGAYSDLTGKPTIPAAQVQVDWNATPSTSDITSILNRPTLATVATTGVYDDLTGKPTIPAAQVQTDWLATGGMGQLLNKPSLATVATTGSYLDLTDKPNVVGQVQANWNSTPSTSDMSSILNRPTLATVATTGEYSDLLNPPPIPSVTNKVDIDTPITSTKVIRFGTSSDPSHATIEFYTENSGVAGGDGTRIDIRANQPASPGGWIRFISSFPGWDDGDMLILGTRTDSSVTPFITINISPDDPDDPHVLSFNNRRLRFVSDPVDATDAANKQWVESIIPAEQVQSDWDVTDNTSKAFILHKPTIPAAQVQTDWNASSGMGQILNKPTLATVATTGSYNDLTSKPTIPAAQVQTDWNASSGMGQLLNKPTLATVATTGAYSDLTGKPPIPDITPLAVKATDFVTAITATNQGVTETELDPVTAVIPSGTVPTTNPLVNLSQMQSAISAAVSGTGVVAGLTLDTSTGNYNIVTSDQSATFYAYALDSSYNILQEEQPQHEPTYTYWLFASADISNVEMFVLDTRDGLTGAYDFAINENQWIRGRDAVSDFTGAQWDAINSGITSALVSTYDGYATTIGNKADKVSNTAVATPAFLKVAYNNQGVITGSAAVAASDIPDLAISQITNLQTTLDGKATAVTNTAVTTATLLKLTYNNQGVITGSAAVTGSDIPDIAISQVTNLQTTLDGKAAAGSMTAVTTPTFYKIAYNSSGVLTGVTAVAASDIPDIAISQVTNLQTTLDGKATASSVTAVSTSTLLKLTHNAQGIITGSAAATGSDIPDIAISQVTNLQTTLDGKATAGSMTAVSTPTFYKIAYNASGVLTATSAVTGSDIPAIGITQVTSLQNTLDGKADALNISSVGSPTLLKMAYNTQGIVTSSAVVAGSDIPDIAISQVTNLSTTLSGLATASSVTAVTTPTFLKVAYTAQGVISSTSAVAASDIPELPQNKITNLTTDLAAKATASSVTAVSTPTFLKVAYTSQGVISSTAAVAGSDIPDIAISQVTNLQTTLDGKMSGNSAITAVTTPTFLKIAYDAKGLVTGSAAVAASDIPEIPESKVTNLSTDLSNKVDKLQEGTDQKAYIHTGTTQSDLAISDSAGGGLIAKYKADGNMAVGNMANDEDAVNRSQLYNAFQTPLTATNKGASMADLGSVQPIPLVDIVGFAYIAGSYSDAVAYAQANLGMVTFYPKVTE